ncbi:MAG: OsmC family protein, partial [Chloroflexia bacterium]|nr:OsmC family protein [Chloroflexia bacterium]
MRGATDHEWRLDQKRGGREGHAVSDDGVLDVPLRRPTLQGTPDGVNPEQLFAAAWAACFLGGLNTATRGTEIDVSQSTVTVQVSMGPAVEAGGYGLAGK